MAASASDPGKMARAAEVARTLSPFHFVARQATGANSPASEDAATREAVDRVQQIIDIAGIIDQTGVADLSNMLVSLMRAVDEPGERWKHLRHASLSAVSALPALGDLAKFGKQYRTTAHGVAAAEAIDRAATSKGTREAVAASARWAQKHPGTVVAFVQRAAHLLGILTRARQNDQSKLQTTVDVLDELRGAYTDWSSDPSLVSVGERVADEQIERLRERAAGTGDEEEEAEDEAAENIQEATGSLPQPPSSGPAVATGTGSAAAVAPGAAGRGPSRRTYAYAGVAAATIATGGAFAWWRRRQRRKAQQQAQAASGTSYTVRLPDGQVVHYPAAGTSPTTMFATRPGGDETRVFWGTPPQAAVASGVAPRSAADRGDAPPGGHGPIEPPEGPGLMSRLGHGFMRLPGPAITWAGARGVAGAWGAGNRAVTGLWRLPGRAARKTWRTGAQMGLAGPLGMWATGGPKALIQENRELAGSIGGAIRSFKDFITTTERASSALLSLQDHLIQYSGAMAAAKAQYIADQIAREMETARSTGGTYQFLSQRQSSLQDRMVKYHSLSQNLRNAVGGVSSMLADRLLAAFENTSLFGLLVRFLNNQMAGNQNAAAPVVNMLRDIADGKYTQARRPRRVPNSE